MHHLFLSLRNKIIEQLVSLSDCCSQRFLVESWAHRAHLVKAFSKLLVLKSFGGRIIMVGKGRLQYFVCLCHMQKDLFAKRACCKKY